MQIQKNRALKFQIGAAILMVAGMILVTVLMKHLGLAIWLIALVWVVLGFMALVVLRQISKIFVCPKCNLMLSGVQSALDAQKRTLNYCPECGVALGANHSLKADVPDGPRL